MAEDNLYQTDQPGILDVEKKLDRSSGCRLRDQRGFKVKDKHEEGRLPTPPPLPGPQSPQFAGDRRMPGSRVTTSRPDEEEEEEDLVAYLSELGASPVESHSFDYDTPNSATTAMGVTAGSFAEEAFEHLDRLCALTEQILELRDRSSKHFRRVRGLERAKALRNADRRLEMALANDEELLADFPDEDTGFAESLLDAMLSNCRDPPTQRRNERSSVRSPSSRQRSRSLALTEQTLTTTSNVVDHADGDKKTARNAVRNGGPKVSKWTRVKAAFKWERAYTSDLTEIAESNIATPSTPTMRYLRIPDVSASSWSGSALSPCTSEVSSPSTPIGRVSPASSSNEEVFDEPRKNIINSPDRQSPQTKDDRKRDDPDRHGRPIDRDTSIAENVDSIEFSNEVSRSDRPLIRIISDAGSTTHITSGSGKEVPSKRPTPTLTITIPSNEEEIRSLSSPESMSPLPSSAQDSGGSSPQRPKARQDILSSREFKRQYSIIEETITPAPKIQRQDSKWNKVRRAFLTNSTFSVPPSPVRVVAAQSFANDNTRRARSCSESVEDLGKTVAGTNHCRAEALRDYQALREKFGAEFYRKLLEWERLKSNPPRVLAARNVRDGLPLNEERLAPEFRKKLQDWKRAKKGRRSGASIEQQRVSRRRLTDWQLWRSSSKPESRCYGKNQNSVSSRGSCASIGSAGSFASDGKQHLCEDFVKRMEAWRRMGEVACKNSEKPKSPSSRVASDIIDETEFLALEKLLLLFGQKSRKESRESDAKQLNDCFDSDSRFTAASRGVSCGNEVLIRTSVGSYRFEGISREFTRKLYDWEKYRGISPRSSTFRLLGPGYTPFTQDSDEATLTETPSTSGKNRVLHWSLKRSKSDGSVFKDSLRDESYTLRRSTSLHSLISTNKLESDNRMNALPTSNNPRDIKDHSEDTAVEDSEPEAMIVDIEDVIEETASPLERVQPHQTPVYSVAASETTSIAVPLGTVTSSHEPSPVFLVEAEDDDDDCERWNGRTWVDQEARSSENSPSPEHFPVSEDWHDRTTSIDEDKVRWEPWRKEHDREDEATAAGWTEKTGCSIPDDNSVKSDRAIEWNRDAWDEISQRYANEANRHSMVPKLLLTPIYKSNTGKNDTKQQDFLGVQQKNDNAGHAPFAKNLGATSATWSAKKLMDSPRTCERTNETKKIENPAGEPNNEQKNDMKHHQDTEDVKSEEKMLDAGSHTDLLATLSNCRNSREASSNVSTLNLDDNKNLPEYHDADLRKETSARYENLSELQSDVDQHYEILTFKTDTCDNTIDNRFLYEPINYHENRNLPLCSNESNRVRGNLSLSRLPDVERSTLSEIPSNLLIDSTVRTIPITVSRNNEARCLERILINEETLNKIIVPTSAENNTKSAERPRDRLVNADHSEGSTSVSDHRHDDDNATASMTEDHQVACIKKDGFSSRNVFVKTKRMIFGPFRRSEDRPSSRKESDGSVDDRLLRSKSKSKSRSTSPKLCRQDALLRVSLSLPWPLRSSSKESEATSGDESRRSSGGKSEDTVTVQRRNSRCSEFISDEHRDTDDKKPNNQLTNEELLFAEINQPKTHHSVIKPSSTSVNTKSSMGMSSSCVLEQFDRSRVIIVGQDQSTCRRENEDKRGRMQDERERNHIKCSRARNEEKNEDKGRCNERQNEEKPDEVKCNQRQDEMRQQDESHARSDTVPSDLMHKLRILSDAAARREGRVSVAGSSAVSSSESRSSRIRRAKESFLSRRGGPFCRSMMELPEAGGCENDPWRRTFTSQISKPSEVVVSTSKSEETEDVGMEAVTKTPQDEISCSSEDQACAPQEDRDVGVRADLVKSASAGMINVDPDTFGRLVAVDRGCESLPRTIAKRRDSSGPLAKIVSKLKLSRLIRAKNVDGGNMSTISTLCRQSLMISMQSNLEARRGGEVANDPERIADDKGDDGQVESREAIHE